MQRMGVTRAVQAGLVRPTQKLRYGERADVLAHGCADFGGVAKVHSVVHTSAPDFLHEVIDLCPFPRWALDEITGCREGWHRAAADLRLKHRADS